MKHLLPLTLCTLAVAGGLFLAVSVHRGYVHQINLDNARAVALRAQAAIKKQYQVLSNNKKLQVANTDIVLLIAQCKEGQAAYSMLSTYQKQQVRAPYCSYSTVQ